MIELLSAYAEHIALSDEFCNITYSSLRQHIQIVSRILAKERGEIAVCMEHGINYALYLLAAIEAGSRVYLLHPNVNKKTLSYLQQRKVRIYTDIITYDHLKNVYNEDYLCKQINIDDNMMESDNNTFSKDIMSMLILSTSGTTSASPKFVSIPFHNFYLKSKMIAEHLEIKMDDINLSFSPFCFVQSIWALLIHLLNGAAVFFSSFKPNQFDQLLKEKNISTLITTPSVIRGIIDNSISNYQLRLLSIGGDYMDEQLLRNLQFKWPSVKYANIYGATETCAADTILDPKPLHDLDESFFTVGCPSDYSRVFITSDAGEILPPLSKGNICIQSPFIIDHYVNTDASVRCLNGYFPTYDIGYLDMDGRLHYCGRSSSIIVYNGEKISAIEVEDLLYNIDGIKEVVVVGKSHDLCGQIPVAFIVSTSVIPLEEMQKYLISQIEEYKIPKEFYFVDELIRTESGKIVRTYNAYQQ